MRRQLIIDEQRSGWAKSGIYDCCISCDKCPFRFKCYTTRGTLSVTELEYHDATEVIPGIKYLSIVGIGRQI